AGIRGNGGSCRIRSGGCADSLVAGCDCMALPGGTAVISYGVHVALSQLQRPQPGAPTIAPHRDSARQPDISDLELFSAGPAGDGARVCRKWNSHTCWRHSKTYLPETARDGA